MRDRGRRLERPLLALATVPWPRSASGRAVARLTRPRWPAGAGCAVAGATRSAALAEWRALAPRTATLATVPFGPPSRTSCAATRPVAPARPTAQPAAGRSRAA
ncbi:MAG TPA: hypothetical protein VFB06_21630 [Streptosporangiaceae bacterium]|nr:hypothetical protein [Streptosporangiaceae bacterium]